MTWGLGIGDWGLGIGDWGLGRGERGEGASRSGQKKKKGIHCKEQLTSRLSYIVNQITRVYTNQKFLKFFLFLFSNS